MAKFAIITGGSSGIGRHLVSALVRDGYDVAFTHLGQSDAAAEVEAEAAALGGRAVGRECEVANSSAIEGFLDRGRHRLRGRRLGGRRRARRRGARSACRWAGRRPFGGSAPAFSAG